MNLDFSVIVKGNTLFLLLKGLENTIFYSVTGFVLAITIGVVIAFGQISKYKAVQFASNAYLSWFRSTPLLVQLVLVYYGLPLAFKIETEAWICGIIGLGMYSGAYVSAVIRGAIVSIDKGQMEAGRCLGYSYWQTMYKIILPQAVKRAIAPLTNEFISLTKNSAMLSTITVTELFRQTNTLIAKNFKTLELYLTAAVLYYLLNNLVGIVGSYFECKLKTGEELS
ncbi:MAG: amino acid ABC transporter permease [Lachnospiraceae bacterium]|nr:amino acid ABC transporter permease [Lachnospiraceae bacterium]